MSKRSAFSQGGEERYGGGAAPEEMSDRPLQATAAQLAKRKIAQAKGTRRPRSESPMPSTGSIFDQATQNGFLGNNNSNANMAPSNPFASAGGFTFGNNANANPSSQSFGSGGGSFTFGGNQTAQTTPNTNTSFQFGNAAPTNSFTFGGGSPAPQTNGFGGSTPFAGFGQQNGTGFGDSTPKATTPAIFEDNPTPKPANPFGATQPSTGLFGSAPATNGSTGFTFGQKPAEASQASSTTFGGISQNAASQAPKPASDGWSSFTANTAEIPKPATNGFTPSTTSLFGAQSNGNTNATNGSAAPSIFAGFNSAAKPTTGFTFAPQPADVDASMMSPENTPQKPNGVSAAPVQTSSKSLFDRITRSPPKETAQPAPSLFANAPTPAAPKTGLFGAPLPQPVPIEPTISAPPAAQPAVSQPAAPVQPPAPKPQAKSSMDLTKPESYTSFRELNESLLQFLKMQDLNKDLSSIFQYYQTEAAKIASLPAQSTASAAAASKPAEPLYPKLPENASNTAKLFQSALDAPAAQTSAAPSLFSAKPSTFTPSTTSLFATKPAEQSSTSTLFGAKSAAPATNGASGTSLFAPKPAAAPANGLTPSTSLFTPAPAAPASGGFKPTTTSTGGSFLSSFGAAAAKNEEKEKKRRRDEDFDSDEDDAAEWEKRDAEEQAAKRKKIEDAAKNASSFTLKPTAGTTPASNLFAGLAKPAESKKDDAGADHTWKQGTPIKFGLDKTATTTTPAAAPKFNLFGAAAASNGGSSLFSGAAKPAPAFSFGQASSTAPAVSAPAPTAEASAEAEEGDAAPPEPQLEDYARLLPEEENDNEVLLRLEDAGSLPKSMKLESRPTEGGGSKLTWIDKGKGPIWILRNKATGKTRIVQKIEGSGRAAMNFALLKGKGLYKLEGKSGKSVTATFIDHLGGDASKPSSWAIISGKKEDAVEMNRVLNEEQAKL